MRYRCMWAGRLYQIDLERQGENYNATVDGQTYRFEIIDDRPGNLRICFEGSPRTLFWASGEGQQWVSLDGCTYLLERPLPGRLRGSAASQTENSVRSPMPAQVRALYIEEGEDVQQGDPLILLEAMKMEIKVQAPRAGRIGRVSVSTGQTVNRDQELVEFLDL
jgi:acetyl/propionyl-CoA carboxylase alpha subunit